MDALLQAPRKANTQAWWREPWMWLVLGAPLVVVVAAILTGIIAWQAQDKVLGQDYYRKGLQIDQDLQRDSKARLYSMHASLDLLPGHVVRLNLQGAVKLPALAQLELASGKNGLNENQAVYKVNLQQVQPGLYQALLPQPLWAEVQANRHAGWRVRLQGEDWRLTGHWRAGTVLQMQPGA